MGRLTAGILKRLYSKPEYRGERARLAQNLRRINLDIEDRRREAVETDRLVREYRAFGNNTLAYAIEKRGVS